MVMPREEPIMDVRPAIPIRHADGSISGFICYADGQLKLPPKWLPPASNVVTFPKKSA
jgi:hypothetical protein